MSAKLNLSAMPETDALTVVASWLEACAQHIDLDRYGLPAAPFNFEHAWPLVLAIAQPDRLYAHHMNIPQLGLHRDTLELVASFARALATKLRASEIKYGWNLEWKTRDWEHECRHELSAHVAKGDPLDVAAYAAFCWSRGWTTAPPREGRLSRADEDEAQAQASAWTPVAIWPDRDEPIIAATDDGRRMIWAPASLKFAMSAATPRHLQFPATHWMYLSALPAVPQ